MPIQFKVDVLKTLKDGGYSSYRIRKEKIFGQREMQNIREGTMVSLTVVSKICHLLQCQPGDLLEYVEDEQD